MNEIKLQKTQALLQEVLNLALSELANPKLNALSITRVLCSSGKYHAKVFIESSDIAQSERAGILSALKKASPMLREYALSATSWFKCPELSFYFDDSMRESGNLDAIFAQIAKERQKEE
ncbi:30S ribosome-binding factor RbfA [Helicobacter sp. MIT 00-7814]|uniref:30S ribosome-binding factor RbfA n=1 Tax=unclassified Helicobacter TaxID=2593540 RepID=UPI000E1E760E|nr:MULTISPECIES: 30S ribosome-binding factor RbfA [unclassified Helicobacter]RDU56411.1 30S ribosome-binding factor RbfA [Helicobacter sp. MIT 99-10781]RDU56494.1 30S ribosome-binding factor RbfA [Helicobacter sp. MIT 00-7814]